MKKIAVIAVLLVVVGVICAFFFTRGTENEEPINERPWTVAEGATETTKPETTQEEKKDAVSAYSDFVHEKLRDEYTFLSKDVTYDEAAMQNALLGMYVYDLDEDGDEDLTLIRTVDGKANIDVYEFKDGKVQFADTIALELDPMTETGLTTNLSTYSHLAARLTIFPKGKSRFFCLTVEQETLENDYNAYTVTFSYDKGELKKEKSYRLRQKEGVITFVCTDNVSILYSAVTGDAVQSDVAKYKDLNTAFKEEFGTIGLTAPVVKVTDGKLTQYKVNPVENAQMVFEFSAIDNAAQFTNNGFLQSFILN